uniref:Uncharacterized protein n=1 Tax=Arundo donax TaxID=35708 RepID=A0A0A9C306_ARUDO
MMRNGKFLSMVTGHCLSHLFI